MLGLCQEKVKTVFGLYLDCVLTDLDDFQPKENFEQKLECRSAQLNLFSKYFSLENKITGTFNASLFQFLVKGYPGP